jgi:small neutral amino acid transporter SnatA (MarC family)
LVAVLLGLLLLAKWWIYFLRGLQATVPAILILGGLVALFAAISEIKDSFSCKKEETKKE